MNGKRYGVCSANLLLGPLADPVEDRVVPEQAILRPENPVALIGKEQQLRRHVLLLQDGEALHALAGDIAEILLAVDYQRGGACDRCRRSDRGGS